ncbi:MAG: ABC transporter permease [Clostridia bacterium]|nr:ABC transporter permease [Clostridia bacterium]MBR4031715.1 ABC transporter permease [Clostridia bacterium]
MLKYIFKRLLLSVLILLGVSLILFVLIQNMPSSFAENKINEMNAGGAIVDQATKDAIMEMYDMSYGEWLLRIVTLDFGESFTQSMPVVDVIKRDMFVSFLVAAIATVFEFMIAIPLGITAATHQYSFRDYLVTVLVMIGISLPSFFFGQVLKGVFSTGLGWLPSSGLGDATQSATGIAYILEYIKYLILPIMTVVILSIGGRMRMTRTNMLEVLNSDYIRTARAKGLKERVVVFKHAFRNTMIPLVTSLAGLLPSLFSGAIITEQVFDLPGIGNTAYDAMIVGDVPVIMGYNMFLALLSIIGVLLADLMYAVVDPRVKLQ